MIERFTKYVEDVQQLELWMQTYPTHRPKEMPQEMADHLERLQLAYRWLIDHGGSKRKVWPMMLVHFKKLGKPYSESTARRDVNDAQQLFRTLGKFTARFVTELQIDRLLERLDSCARNDKDREYAMLSVALDKFLDRADRYAREDEEAITAAIPIMQVFDPQEAGITPISNVTERIAEWRQRREAIESRHMAGAEDATFQEDPQ